MKLSEHFTLAEFACHCGCGFEKEPKVLAQLKRLVGPLEKLRAALGAPLHINSGVRCPAYNKAIGGALLSQHKVGTACDVTCATYTPAKVYQMAATIPEFKGLGSYATFTHVDVRQQPWRSTWKG